MEEMVLMKIIARIHTEFPEKFGIPRQSGLVGELKGRIVFEPEYRDRNALLGLEDYSHIWLLWEFSENVRSTWSPTVRPPRLGGNVRRGVFATRSPFRPNPIGLSLVELERIEMDSQNGPVLHVRGADLMDGTPVFDIKPYLPHTESVPFARGGFAAEVKDYVLEVEIPEEFAVKVQGDRLETLKKVLAEDPRPSYQKDPNRVYGMTFSGLEVHFRVDGRVLTVCGLEESGAQGQQPRMGE